MGGSGTMAGAGGSAGGGATKWVGTWATGPQLTETENNPPTPGLANNTLRQIFRVSIGGSSLRLRLSNEYGDGPVTMSAVHLAKSTSAGAIDTASDKALTFGGMASVTIQSGKTADSDAFDFDLAPLSKVAVTIQFGTTPSGITGHPGSRTTSYLVSGDMVGAASITGSTAEHWYYISALDVIAPENAYSVAILGDSITDGRGSTTDGNDRWPDKLAERLQANAATKNIGVLNLGIGGNAILTGGKGPTAKARFDVQILGQSGVKWFIVLEGVNDIGNAGSAQGSQLDSAFQEFITKAKAKGVLAYGSPILPFGGSSYSSPEHEADRQTVNDWVRAAGHFDAVIDLDAAVRDSSNAANLAAAYDSGDQLHLNPAGYAKMAEAVDLMLLTP
jgi:lysophospholipase L1-like esterase